tara:strand:- start:1148 stop:1261 length:114 start_codon:yes stop_codon:yes gene_type:complete
MSRKKLYDHFILTNWRGLNTKIKQMKKKFQTKKDEKI